MLPRNPYQAMALNNAWANATLYAATTALDAAALAAARPGFFPSLSLTLNHIYVVDLYYFDALEAGGLGRSIFDRAKVANASQLAKSQAAADQRLIAFCTDIDPAMLANICYTERHHGMTPERTDAVLLHLFQHQIHHRGQAHVQLQDAGVAPPQLDDFFLEYGRIPTAQAMLV